MQHKIIQISRSRQAIKPRVRRELQGYVLLSVMLLITLMLIALSVELPRIAQQVKRDKEEELVNRGMDSARAIKRFYHKFNNYPASIEQLKDTNHIRFLRKEYKDPMTGESDWKLVHANEAEIKIPQGNGPGGLQGTNPGLTGSNTPGAQPTGTAGVNSTGAATTGGASSGFSGSSSGFSGGSSGLSGGSSGLSGGSSGLSGGSSGLTGSSNAGFSGSTNPQAAGTGGGASTQGGSGGALQTTNIGLGNSGPTQVGGGQIIGFASTSKKASIKEFNDKSEYDQWYFVYDPRLEQVGPNQIGSANGGLTIAAPRGGNGNGQGTPGGLAGSQPSPQNGGTPGGTPQQPRQ